MPEGYRRTRRANGSRRLPVRSLRIEDALWERARKRATLENVTMSQVLLAFVQGYAAGAISLPRMQPIYTQPVQQGQEEVAS